MKKNIFLWVAAAIFVGLAIIIIIYYAGAKPELPPAAVIGRGASADKLSSPLYRALERVTKKPFGIYITPQRSPVAPEKFTGYHTGADFEIFSGEENKNISIFAICGGKLLVREFGRGYGGMAVQSCNVGGQLVTVVYGHLKLESIILKIGDNVAAGTIIGILGRGYTDETDRERKHLHLGIHKGAAVDTRGYVISKSELSKWIDPMTLLK